MKTTSKRILVLLPALILAGLAVLIAIGPLQDNATMTSTAVVVDDSPPEIGPKWGEQRWEVKKVRLDDTLSVYVSTPIGIGEADTMSFTFYPHPGYRPLLKHLTVNEFKVVFNLCFENCQDKEAEFEAILMDVSGRVVMASENWVILDTWSLGTIAIVGFYDESELPPRGSEQTIPEVKIYLSDPTSPSRPFVGQWDPWPSRLKPVAEEAGYRRI